jgi:ribosomal protein S19E (S16A)
VSKGIRPVSRGVMTVRKALMAVRRARAHNLLKEGMVEVPNTRGRCLTQEGGCLTQEPNTRA